MATALHIRTFEVGPPAAPSITVAVEKSDSHWLKRTASPREEARILFEMMQRSGGTVESFRELIAIPPQIQKALILYARKHPEDAFGVERVLAFRKRVDEEFERLICGTFKTAGKSNICQLQEKRNPQQGESQPHEIRVFGGNQGGGFPFIPSRTRIRA